jgi:hypothetical protein
MTAQAIHVIGDDVTGSNDSAAGNNGTGDSTTARTTKEQR